MTQTNIHQMWLLRLVPPVAYGRWWCALIIFLSLLLLFAIAGVFGNVETPTQVWPAALFFCAVLAYIVPIFHYITQRTELAFDELSPQLAASPEAIVRWRTGISSKSTAWMVNTTLLGASLWLLQGRLLADSFTSFLGNLAGNSVDLAMTLGPLPVWLIVTGVTSVLVDNARLFRTLAARTRVSLLDTRALNPFGRMAVSSTLVVIGIQALFPIMWLDAGTDPWTTIPGLVFTTFALVYLFVAPTWPVHQALRQAKQRELSVLRDRINSECRQSSDIAASQTLSALLIYRREIASAAEWPFDISIVARFGLYLVVVPLTWVGAALIENLVDLFIST